MLFAMCADAGMLISLLVFLLIVGVVLSALTVLAMIGILKLFEAWRGRLGAIRLSPEVMPPWPEHVP